MNFQNASKYYVALAFYVSPESRDTWIHMKKSAIEKTMRTCGIQHLTILSDVKQGPYWTNEFFNSNYTSPKGKRYGNLDNFTDSFLFLLQEYNYSPKEIHQNIHNAIECFMNTFQKQLRVEDEEFMSHSAVVLYQVTGKSYREIIYTLPLSKDENEEEYDDDDEEEYDEEEYDEEEYDEEENIDRDEEDCSNEINRINFLTNKINDLEKYISSIERERDYCNETKTRIEDQHNAVLIRLDNLRSELNKFKSKDPEQLKKNIETLQRELEQIKKDEEKQRQQQERQEQNERQRQEQERQRQEQERQRQEQERQRQQGKNKNRLLDPPPRERIKNKDDPFYVLDLPNPGSKFIDETNKKNIKKQFRKLSLIYHPDKNKDNNATEDFQALNNAWETIKKLYDINGGSKKTKKNTMNKKTKRGKKTKKNTMNKKTKRGKKTKLGKKTKKY